MAMKSGGLADAAKLLQSKGRNGDTILAHINPREAEMLRSAGGLGSINPYTGLREYSYLSDRWKAVTAPARTVVKAVKKVAASPIGKIALTIGLTMALGPAGLNLGLGMASTAAIVGGGVAALGGGNLKDVLKGAAMGYIGGTIAPTIGGYMPGAAGSVLNQGFTGAALGTGFGLAAGMSPAEALKAGAIGGLTGAGVTYGQQQGYIPGGQAGAPRAEAPADAELSLPPIESTGPISSVAPVGTATENLSLPVTDKYSPYYTGEPAAPVDNFLISQAQANQVANAPGYTPNLSAQSQYLMDRAPGDYGLNTASDYVQARGMSPGAGLGVQGPQPTSLTGGFNPPPGDQGLLNAGIGNAPGLTIPQQGFAPVEDRSTISTGRPENIGPAPVEDRSSYSLGARGEQVLNPVKDFYNRTFATDRPGIQQGNEQAALEGDKAVAAYKARMEAAGIKPTAAGAEAAYDSAYQSSAPGFMSKYAPLAGAALGATYLAGGFKTPTTPEDATPIYDTAYTGSDYIADNPELFSGSLYKYTPSDSSFYKYDSKGVGSYDPTRSTAYDRGEGNTSPGVVVPTGIMQAQYAPDYGRRRTQALQQYYYSPFIGTAEPIMAAKGGSIREFPRKTGPINGPGTGTSDDIPAMLSDGEFVFTARAVRNAGNGSRRKGAARMYKLMKSLEKGGMVKG
jgi:hypothetical protein